MKKYMPVYLETYRKGLLRKKINAAYKILNRCTLCPRRCKVNRTSGETGICNTGIAAMVSSFHPHFGEEAPLVGRYGSGTIFFTNCNLLCCFCQNFDISHEGCGREVSDTELAGMMLFLQKEGCHNINFVTPSHVVPQILSALEAAVEMGLSIPIVYNTSAYDSMAALTLLDGIVDIYMPDFKFWQSAPAKLTCDAPDYPEIAKKTVMEMHRQVGDLVIGNSGIAEKGLLIRHLVMPEDFAGTDEILKFIAEKISKNTYVNIMAQYRPCGRAHEIRKIARALRIDEYNTALKAAKAYGLCRLD